jgi:hypothetical protein
MTIAKTMTALDLKLTPPKGLAPEDRRAWDAYYEPRNAAFELAMPGDRHSGVDRQQHLDMNSVSAE